MNLYTRKTVRLAVLIDAENIGAKYIEPLLGEVAKLGTATAKRIYGDWTQPQHAGWRNVLNLHALIPVQQFRLSAGKNCTDCALIIDAMDLLYSGNFDGFCVVSSDSDFTRLACRIRESGLLVYGFGEGKTPVSFVKSCDRFIALELLANPAEAQDFEVTPPALTAIEGNKKGMGGSNLGSAGKDGCLPGTAVAATVVGSKDGHPPNGVAASRRAMRKDRALTSQVERAYASVAGEDGWAHLASFGSQMLKLSPSFDPRSFGCSKLGDFVLAIDLFEIKKVPSPKNPLSQSWYIKAK
jgi:uncharacterized LabA/DUF88 family protein